jgi:ribosomal peptide maturation radical SAM protein 1
MDDVLLINMPFTNLFTPSIGLGLLKASLTRIGISSKAIDFHLRFAELIGQEIYHSIERKTNPEHLVGEWIFSESLFHHPKNSNLDNYVSNVLRVNTVDLGEPVYAETSLDELEAAIQIARGRVNDFLDKCLETVLAHNPRVVGFTSMFAQHVAALSLAKRIKSSRPQCFIIFGGSNCEGVMGAETLRQFEFIDAVVSGEGDFVFPEIVQSILASNTIPPIQGIFSRKRPPLQLAGQPPHNTSFIRELDKLPIPDYDDYFANLSQSSLQPKKRPTLLFETSRGCWWGEKLHCTFCGLNGATMAYRSKSAPRALEELTYLADRYPGCGINAVDNILDMKYFKTFLKLLAERKREFGLFYEVKANLRKDQVKLLLEAGIKVIQPGIESFSDNVLRIMRKGVTALQNIQLLKWCTELGLKVIYNIIWGFPRETPDDYKKTIELIPLISHLRPPVGSGTIRIDRFSPNFNTHLELGFGELSPFPAYGYVYPFDPKTVFNLAYYFVPEYEEVAIEKYDTKGLSRQIKSWKESYEQSDLFFMDKGSQLFIWDLRPVAREALVILDDYAKLVYLSCDAATTRQQIHNCWEKVSSKPLDEGHLKDTLESFIDRGLMIRDGEQYLSLAYQRSV